MNKIHLSNIHNFTLQQVFDRVATHLLTQKAPAMKNGDCCYRTKTGLTCAVGCLMTDNEYDPDFEGRGVLENVFDQYFTDEGYCGPFIPLDAEPEDEHRRLLRSLQNAHDNAGYYVSDMGKDFTEGVISELLHVAEKFGLDDSVLRA